MEALSDVLSREEFDAAYKNIYSDGMKHDVPWREDDDSVTVETAAGQPPLRIKFRAPSAHEAPLPRYWRKAGELPPLKEGEGVLSGIHIALDPGHIGGSYAVMEERWLSMKPGEVVMEGQLTLMVAIVLKARLEALGAHVSLVRQNEAPVTTAKADDLKDAARKLLAEAGIAKPAEAYAGLTGDAKIITVQWQAEKLFYRVSEIRARAKKVNDDLKPDLVICLHFNAAEWGDPAKPAFVSENHLHLLVNGCYSADELQLEDIRFEMFQRLFGRIQGEETKLGTEVADAMAKTTGLPPFTYPGHNARRVGNNPYLWSRNLLANRMYQCPVIYIEPYVMNNELTYKRLLLGHFIGRTLLDSELVTSPLEDYARGVTQGLVSYFQKARGAVE